MTELLIKKEQPLPSWVWEKSAAPEHLMSPDPGRREDPGQKRSIRRDTNPQVWARVDPEILPGARPAPEHVTAALEQVFGIDRCYVDGDPQLGVKLKVVYHPWYQRLCLVEYAKEPGKPEYWGVVSIFMHEPVPGVLASDFRDNPYKQHWRGQKLGATGTVLGIGEYREPTHEDFRLIEQTDRVRYGVAAVDEFFEQPIAEQERDKERAMHDVECELVDYETRHHINMANRRAGAGQNMMVTWTDDMHHTSIAFRDDPAKYRIREADGYRTRERYTPKDRREYLEEVFVRWQQRGCPGGLGVEDVWFEKYKNDLFELADIREAEAEEARTKQRARYRMIQATANDIEEVTATQSNTDEAQRLQRIRFLRGEQKVL